MTQPDKQVTQSACRALLKPVVSFLLKCGLTWREFAAIAKSVFVEVASREYGLRGRPTNISRVAKSFDTGKPLIGRPENGGFLGTPIVRILVSVIFRFERHSNNGASCRCTFVVFFNIFDDDVWTLENRTCE